MHNARKSMKIKATKTLMTLVPNMKSRNCACKVTNSKKSLTWLSAAKTARPTLSSVSFAKEKVITLELNTKRVKRAKVRAVKSLLTRMVPETSERTNWRNVPPPIVRSSSTPNVSSNTIQKSCSSTLMQTQCTSDVLFITATLVVSVATRCQFINVCGAPRHFIHDVWTKKRLPKCQKSSSFVRLTSRIRKIWKRPKTGFRRKHWNSSSRLKRWRQRKKRSKKWKLLERRVLMSKKKTRWCIITQQEETEAVTMNLAKIWAQSQSLRKPLQKAKSKKSASRRKRLGLW